MENALYYTLSTIAQSLAGALAVLIAIVLFNWSKISDYSKLDSTVPQHATAKQVPGFLKVTVLFSLGTMALCFLALPLAPLIAPHRDATVAVLAVACGLALLCLVLYWKLIWTVMNLP